MAHEPDVTHDPLARLRSSLERQYHAALAMHRDAVERCPARLWSDATPTNAFWQVAYHTLFFTHEWAAVQTLEGEWL